VIKRIHYNHNNRLLRFKSIHARTQTTCTAKGTCWTSLWVQWNTHGKRLFSAGEGWASRSEFSPGSVSDGDFELRSWGLCEASRSEGDAGAAAAVRESSRGLSWCHCLSSREIMTSGIGEFPSRPQSVGGNPGILRAARQFPYFPDCAVLPCWSGQPEFLVRPGSAWSLQLAAPVQRQGKCRVVGPARCACSAGKNTMSAGSEITRGAVPPRCSGLGKPCSFTAPHWACAPPSRLSSELTPARRRLPCCGAGTQYSRCDLLSAE